MAFVCSQCLKPVSAMGACENCRIVQARQIEYEPATQVAQECPLGSVTDEACERCVTGEGECLALEKIGATCPDEGCPHYGTPHSHVSSPWTLKSTAWPKPKLPECVVTMHSDMSAQPPSFTTTFELNEDDSKVLEEFFDSFNIQPSFATTFEHLLDKLAEIVGQGMMRYTSVAPIWEYRYNTWTGLWEETDAAFRQRFSKVI